MGLRELVQIISISLYCVVSDSHPESKKCLQEDCPGNWTETTGIEVLFDVYSQFLPNLFYSYTELISSM